MLSLHTYWQLKSFVVVVALVVAAAGKFPRQTWEAVEKTPASSRTDNTQHKYTYTQYAATCAFPFPSCCPLSLSFSLFPSQFHSSDSGYIWVSWRANRIVINASFCIDARGILAAFGLHWIWDRNSEWNWRFMLYKRRGEGAMGICWSCCRCSICAVGAASSGETRFVGAQQTNLIKLTGAICFELSSLLAESVENLARVFAFYTRHQWG